MKRKVKCRPSPTQDIRHELDSDQSIYASKTAQNLVDHKTDNELFKAYRAGKQHDLTDAERNRLHSLPEFISECSISTPPVTPKDARLTKPTESQSDIEDALRALGVVPEDATDFVDRHIEEPVWIIQDLIAKHFQAALIGKAKSKKTFFGLHLAQAVATGTQFLKWQIKKARRVAYFNLELLPFFMQERMSAQLSALPAPIQKGNLYIFNLRGHAELLRKLIAPTEGGKGLLLRWLKCIGIDLAIIDPRYKLMQGQEDENTAAGLRALLMLRAAIADVCAVLMISHDPKGDISNKATSDRGAGSYTAIADDDATILLTPNTNGGEGVEAVTVETIHRSRKAPHPFTAIFDEKSLTFKVDDKISPNTSLGKTHRLTYSAKAEMNAEKLKLFRQAAVEVADENGDNFIDCTTFKAQMSMKPNGNVFGTIDSKAFRNAWRLITEGKDCILKKCDKLENKPDGSIGKPRKRTELVSTVARIDNYLAQTSIAS